MSVRVKPLVINDVDFGIDSIQSQQEDGTWRQIAVKGRTDKHPIQFTITNPSPRLIAECQEAVTGQFLGNHPVQIAYSPRDLEDDGQTGTTQQDTETPVLDL